MLLSRLVLAVGLVIASLTIIYSSSIQFDDTTSAVVEDELDEVNKMII